ncbi:hypothetical protein [Micrococcus sp. TA1]|uniref:hypothetical protein n=1 Tax=Micrococcus sp. TA1 TaxID=681627 RepID=UPI00161DC5A4|nr:hypothetical protein [Micrococcus sp. TA1]MBB5748567.1 hypothetical protein [Micrococcus sp. TA1]
MTTTKATETYAVISKGTLDNGQEAWTAIVYLKGRKRTQVLSGSSESVIRLRCRQFGVTDLRNLNGRPA